MEETHESGFFGEEEKNSGRDLLEKKPFCWKKLVSKTAQIWQPCSTFLYIEARSFFPIHSSSFKGHSGFFRMSCTNHEFKKRDRS
jgi:hypothetical protein